MVTRPRPTIAAVAAVFSCMLFLLLFQHSSASAQPCQNSNCTGVKIYNCTSIDFKLKLTLCCGGTTVISPTVAVPATPCPNTAAAPDFAPCTIIGIAAISPAPPPGITVVYDPISCVIKIY